MSKNSENLRKSNFLVSFQSKIQNFFQDANKFSSHLPADNRDENNIESMKLFETSAQTNGPVPNQQLLTGSMESNQQKEVNAWNTQTPFTQGQDFNNSAESLNFFQYSNSAFSKRSLKTHSTQKPYSSQTEEENNSSSVSNSESNSNLNSNVAKDGRLSSQSKVRELGSSSADRNLARFSSNNTNNNAPLSSSFNTLSSSSYGSTSNAQLKSNSKLMDVSKQQVVSITYEEIGLFPRSFNRVFDRFFKQLFFDVDNLVIQEYRFYRYLFLTTVQCVFLLVFVPITVNFIAKTYLVGPITEYYWNKNQPEIFLNAYQQKRAFSELKDYEEKLYFESLVYSNVTKPNNILKISPHSQEPERVVSESLVTNDVAPIFGVGASKNFAPTLGLSQTNVITQRNTSTLNMSLPQDFKILNKEGTAKSKNEMLLLTTDPLESLPFYNTNNNSVSGKLFQVANAQSLDSKGLTTLVQGNDVLVSSIDAGVLNIESGLSDSISPKPNFLLTNFPYPTSPVSSLEVRYSEAMMTKILELAKHYNEESIEAITNFFADALSFGTLCILLLNLEIQINITKSFLLEVFFGLDDSKKSLLILFITDLLVGYHSPNIWELFFQSLFDHYGLPESQTTIFLLVATLPVLLDVLFKYLIFRHLNRASPATVATYHAMIE